MTTSAQLAAKTASSDRTPALTGPRSNAPASQPKPAAARGSLARRFLDALMRSLAAQHV